MAIDPDLMDVDVEEEPLFTFVKEFEVDGGKKNLYNWQYKVPFGLIYASAGACSIIGISFMECDPKGFEVLKQVKPEDYISVSVDKSDKYYQFWKPEGEYEIPDGYHEMYRVCKIAKGSKDEPILFCKTVKL